MNFKRISARNMHFKLQEGDTNEKTVDALKTLVQEKKNFKHVMMTRSGDILLSSDKQIQMTYGEGTLQNWLCTKHPPIRIRDYDPLPDSFLQHYFADGYNAEKVLYKIGKKFEDAVITKMVKEKVDRENNKRRNEEIVQSNVNDLVKRGTITMKEVIQMRRSGI